MDFGHGAWGIGHGALVLSLPLRGSKLRVASRREAEVLGIGHWAWEKRRQKAALRLRSVTRQKFFNARILN
ncbi:MULTISPECIES: hypothetical protein [Nostoc]|uniref:Uncharacterized protein n=1 Tax=Nostoc paludosum FACHB-159 TaxID=2692908 RepID=A0ABR8KD69_9NOSO|nr:MULTISPECIES: hypothetical protein [Nostoc]MBD2736674.1 hypothetical protein [Nostoc paludosum FACHB-159]